MQKIIFTNIYDVPEDYFPKAALKEIPDWYKNLESYIGGEKKPDGSARGAATGKKCMPMFDAITLGYIIFTHTDLWISQKEEYGDVLTYFEWASSPAIEFHDKDQLPGYPLSSPNGSAHPKWVNSWGIETPSGYSSLFIPPMHRDNDIIIFPGVVDTDKYTSPVNFPFMLKDPKMEGLIPAGTAIAQVIPFKRDSWSSELGTTESIIKQNKIANKMRTKFFDGYKNYFRQEKKYL